MFFTTRDIAVLGYLYLNDGEINGVQIVPISIIEIIRNMPVKIGLFLSILLSYLNRSKIF